MVTATIRFRHRITMHSWQTMFLEMGLKCVLCSSFKILKGLLSQTNWVMIIIFQILEISTAALVSAFTTICT